MNRMLASLGLTSALLASLMLAGTVAAQSPSAAPRVGWMQRTFSDGLKRLGLLFSDVASLASGPAAGEVWQFDSRTGRRRPIPAKTGLSWPAPSPDGSAVYALRGRQVVRIAISNGEEAPVGAPADWRKLLGVPAGWHCHRLGRRRPVPARGAPRSGRQAHGPSSARHQRRTQADRRPSAGGARLLRRRKARGARFGARRARSRRFPDRRRARAKLERLR